MAPEQRRRALELVSRLRHIDREMAEATIELMTIMADAGKEDFAVIEKEYEALFRDRQERMNLVVQSNAAKKVHARKVDDVMAFLRLQAPGQTTVLMVSPIEKEIDPLENCTCGHEARHHGYDDTKIASGMCRYCGCGEFERKPRRL